MASFIDHLDRDRELSDSVLDWGCPVPYFGEIGRATIATVGINPSNREFVDERGIELKGHGRRFPTRQHLGIESWASASSLDVRTIVTACSSYFRANPYTRWFGVLEGVVGACGASYYPEPDRLGACHIDLIPFATAVKWGEISGSTQRMLLERCGGAVGGVIQDSLVTTLILNGRSVVRQFEVLAGIKLFERPQPTWNLCRDSGSDVLGLSYEGFVEDVGGVDLGRRIQVVGYNHNLQSSFGVSRSTIDAIMAWLRRMVLR
jgi:hypothetical protein